VTYVHVDRAMVRQEDPRAVHEAEGPSAERLLVLEHQARQVDQRAVLEAEVLWAVRQLVEVRQERQEVPAVGLLVGLQTTPENIG
jgi:hypothetical protein